MKSQIKKLPKSQVELEIEISPEEFDKYINQTILDLAKNAEVEGFRKGKAPVELAKQRIGEQKILIEAAESAIKDNYVKAVQENKIEPISHPEVEIIKMAKGNPFVFKVKVYLLPQVELPDYKKIASKIKKNEINVTEKEIEETLEWAKKSRTKLTLKDGAAENGDFVDIEYWISEEGSPVAPQNIKDAFILGEGRLLADFEKEIIGMKAGEEKDDIAFAVPEDCVQKEMAGKKVKSKIKLNSVQNIELPEINDEFAKAAGNFKDLAEFRRSISEGIKEEKEHYERHRLRDEILDKICKEIKWDIPDFLVQEEQKRLVQDLKDRVFRDLKVPFEEYLKGMQKTEKEVLDSFKPQAENRTKSFLVLRNIQESEKILASPQEIEEETNKMLRHYKNEKMAGKDLDLERAKLYTEERIKEEKVFKLLESFAR